MCFQVYLGSSRECAELPYSERWDHLFVLKHPQRSGYLGSVGLTTPYQYHVGVMSCGCGLPYDFPVGQSDEWTQKNHRELCDYISKCLENAEPIELFTSWSGDEMKPVEKHRHITLQDLQDREFYFEERELTLVYKDTDSLQAAKA
jgi:hypothetical protein